MKSSDTLCTDHYQGFIFQCTMTRKCVLCKETNYKNTYSFFSAPKDPETRKKWQDAIAIKNYAVGDETYVCSKHFHKNDIITHWVSGIPPHVITIKYKKCRLRPGAVPGRNYCVETNIAKPEVDSETYDLNDTLDDTRNKTLKMDRENKEENFLIPREKNITDRVGSNESIQKYKACFTKKNYSDANQDNKQYSIHFLEDTSQDLLDDSKQDTNISTESFGQEEGTESVENHSFKDTIEKNLISSKEQNNLCNIASRCMGDGSKMFQSDETSILESVWKYKEDKRSFISNSYPNNFVTTMDIEREIESDLSNKDSFDVLEHFPCNSVVENEMLFEDLLEVYTEVGLPRGWSCMVTSKGHTTTIVYLYMGMTRNGLPFVEKQVFVKSDMILRCAATNQEIDPLIHNLVREGKHVKVQSMLDIEEIIDEFDQRTVCEGMFNKQGIQKTELSRIAYKDGVRWRHASCPLIINNDSSRCSKCMALSCMLTDKSKKLFLKSYNSVVYLRKRKRINVDQRVQRRFKGRNRYHEFIKICKK